MAFERPAVDQLPFPSRWKQTQTRTHAGLKRRQSPSTWRMRVSVSIPLVPRGVLDWINGRSDRSALNRRPLWIPCCVFSYKTTDTIPPPLSWWYMRTGRPFELRSISCGWLVTTGRSSCASPERSNVIFLSSGVAACAHAQTWEKSSVTPLPHPPAYRSLHRRFARSSSTGTSSRSSSPSTGRVSSTRRARPRATTTKLLPRTTAAAPKPLRRDRRARVLLIWWAACALSLVNAPIDRTPGIVPALPQEENKAFVSVSFFASLFSVSSCGSMNHHSGSSPCCEVGLRFVGPCVLSYLPTLWRLKGQSSRRWCIVCVPSWDADFGRALLVVYPTRLSC